MGSYRAVFEVPATVQIEVEVNGAMDQTEALAMAHDQLAKASKSSATVMELDIDNAMNAALNRFYPEDEATPMAVEQEVTTKAVTALPQSSPSSSLSLNLYPGALPEKGGTREPVIVLKVQVQEQGVLLLKSLVVDTLGAYGSGAIVDDASGLVLHSETNARGGWEVSVIVPSTGKSESTSWLTKEDAFALAFKHVAQDSATVVISDFSDRALGVKPYRTIV